MIFGIFDAAVMHIQSVDLSGGRILYKSFEIFSRPPLQL